MGDDVGVDPDRFGASRYQYIYPPGGEGIACVGNAAECDHLTIDGAVRIPWRGSPRPEDVERIRSLHLCPTAVQVRRPALPEYLPTLLNLESLTLPTPLVAGLASAGVGERLRTLVVSHSPDTPPPATPLAAADALPGLRALMWVDTSREPRLP